MPIYSYACSSCDHEFELRQGFDASPEHKCPRCHKKARRTFHPVGVIYKGTGFYTTDYRRPSSGSSEDLPSATPSTSSKAGQDDQGTSSKAGQDDQGTSSKAGQGDQGTSSKAGQGDQD